MKKYSIIVVCLNAGDKLNDTLRSIFSQNYDDYEVIVKDGGSTDGSIENMLGDNRIRLYTEKDTGIYDAMNQAVGYAQGEFIIFMNCGDKFHGTDVLSTAARYIEAEPDREKLILYGKIYNEKTASWITPSPKITGFTCYRNVPCHQSCIYAAALCKEKAYDTRYKIRADYEHFLWCYYRAGAKMVYMDSGVADYEGGGFSETKENLKRSKEEHKKITALYMSKGELLRYKAILLCTLAPLRTKLEQSRAFSGLYHKLTTALYGKR